MLKRHVPSARFPRRCVIDRVKIVFAIACVLAWTSSVHAASIALLRPATRSPEVTEALFRLQGEMLSVGLEVTFTQRPPYFGSESSERNAWFERMATEHRVDAIIDVLGDPTPVGVDVWIFEHEAQRFRASRVVLEPNTPNAPETLAIRAIEVLRSNFLVLDLDGKQPARPPLPEPTRDAPPPRSERLQTAPRFGLAAGMSLLTSFDGVGPAVLPLVRFDLRLAAGLAATATLSGFGTRPTVTTDAGSVEVAQDYGTLGLRYSVPADAALRAFAALGAGALRTALEGSADAPNQGHAVDQWSFVAEASLGATWHLSPRYTLSLAAHVQLAEPYAAIHFVDTEVATTGRPNLLTSLTLGAWL